MRKIYTYLAVFLLSFLGIQDLSAQCGIILNGTTYTTSVAAGRATINITINQGENVTMTNTSASTGAPFIWNAGQTTGVPHAMATNEITTAGAVFTLPTSTLTPCSYVITVNMGSSTCASAATVPGLLINVTVQSNFDYEINGTPYTVPVLFPLGVPVTIAPVPPPAGADYTWTLGTVTSTTASITNSTLTSGAYTGHVTITYPACNLPTSVETASFLLTVGDACGMTLRGVNYNGTTVTPATANITIDQGEDLSFTALGSSTSLNWSSAIAPALITPTSAGTAGYTIPTSTLPPCNYQVTVTVGASNGSCLTGSTLVINLTIRPRLSLNTIPIVNTTSSICRGGTISLLAAGGTGATYLWNFNGSTAAGASFPPVTGLPNGSYSGTLAVTNSACAATSVTNRSFTINVQEQAALLANLDTISGGTTSWCEGDNVTLSTISPASSYRWNVSGTTGSSSTLALTNMQTGVYSGRVTLTNTSVTACAGLIEIIDFTINIEAKPTGINFTSPNGVVGVGDILPVCAGSTGVQITANCPGGTCPLSSSGYVWSTGHTGQTLTIATIAAVPQSFVVTLTNSLGCSTSKTIQVSPLSRPVVTISGPASVCSGDTIVLTPTPSSCVACNNSLTYIWGSSSVSTNVAPNLQGTTFPILQAQPTNTNSTNADVVYTVNATNANGCQSLAMHTVTVRSVWQGSININPISDMCRSSALTLTSNCTGSCVGAIYEWHNTTPILNPAILSSASDTTLSALTLDTVLNIELRVTQNGCLTKLLGAGEQRVWRNPGISLTTSPSLTACPGSPILATATVTSSPSNNIANYNYTWVSGTPTAQANQRNYGFNADGVVSVTAFYNPVPEITCATTRQLTVSVPSLGAMSVTSSATTVCLGATSVITAIPPTSFAAVSYSWASIENAAVSAISVSVATVTPSTTSIYSVTATNATGCKLIGRDTISVLYPPTASIIDPGAPLCPVSTVIRSVVSGGRPPYNYTWLPAGTADSLVTTLGAVTAVNLTVTDANNCTAINTRSISATCGSLTLSRSLNKSIYCEGDSIRLIATSTGTITNPSFQWSTGRVRNNVSADTITLRPPLSSDIYSVLVSNGSADFKVTGLRRGYPASANANAESFLVTTNPSSGTDANYHPILADDGRIGIAFDGNGEVINGVSADTEKGLVLNPSLDFSANNYLYPTSVMTIYLESNSPTGTVPVIKSVIFDNKYHGRIIQQHAGLGAHTTKRYINVQVPCMLADEPVSLVIETTASQLKRTARCVRVKPNSINSTAPEAGAITYTVPSVVQAPRVSATLPDNVIVEGTNFRKNNFTFAVSEQSNLIGLSAGTYRFYNTANITRQTSGAPVQTITIASGATTLATIDMGSGLFDIPAGSVSFDVTLAQFPLTITTTRASGFAPTGTGGGDKGIDDAIWAISASSASQIATSTFSATTITAPGYSFSAATVPLTPSYTVTYTAGSTTVTNISTAAITSGATITTISLANVMAGSVTPNRSPLNWNSSGVGATLTATSGLNIIHNNTGHSENVTLVFNKPTPDNVPISGSTTTAEGPSIITDISFSDFFRNQANVTPFGTSVTLPSRPLLAPPVSSQGNTGHVCVYEMAPNNSNYDRVYISTNPSAIINLNPNTTSVGAEVAFNLIVERPTIDTMRASLDTICAEDLATVFVDADSNAISYRWRSNPLGADSTIFLSTNIDSLRVSPRFTTRYIVETTSLYGCKAKDSILVFVNPLPGTRITPDDDTITFCQNSSTTLFAVADSVTCAGNCSYAWEAERNGSWVPIGNGQLINRAFEEDVRLSITANGCTDSDEITLKKYTAPTVSIADTALRAICAGQPITLQVLNPVANANYVWNTGPTFPTLIVNTQGGYYVEMTDSNGCTALSAPVLVINTTEGQNALVSANPATVCNVTAPAVLSVTPCLDCRYTWFRDYPTYVDEVQPLGPSRTYSTTTTGDYFAEVTNRYNCTFRTSNLFSVVSVTNSPPVITATATSLCVNSIITIGTPSVAGYTYQWYKNGIIISAQTTNQLVVNTIGSYHLVAGYANGCTSTSNTIIITDSIFAPALDSSATIICNGSFVTLSTPLIIGGQYQWYLDGVAISGAISSAYNATLAGNYYVRVTNAAGCVANTATRTLNVSSIATPVATTDRISICPTDSARLSVSLCPGCQYQWFRNGVAIDLIPSSSNYVRFVQQSGTYDVRVSTPQTNCSQLSNNIAITLRDAPIPSVAAPIQELCGGINPVLQTTACVGCNYSWLRMVSTVPDTVFQPIFGALNDTLYTVTTLGTYSVQVSYANGCVVRSTQQIIIDGGFTTNISDNSDSTICNNSPIGFTATVIPATRCTGGCQYQWFRNGLPLATTASATYSPPLAQRLGGTYQVRVITPTGCTSESNLLPITSITLAPNIQGSAAAICGNTPVTLEVSNCPGGCDTIAYTYLWSNGSTADTLVTTTSTSYIATVTLDGVCSATTPPFALNTLASLGTTIGINGVTVSTASICAGDSVRMDLIGGCTACTYQWVRDTVTFTHVPTATLNNYSTNVPNYYALIANDTTNNCRDTSNFILLQQVNGFSGFALNFDGVSLAASGSQVDLDTLGLGLNPTALHTMMGQYSSIPLFAYNPPRFNPGLNNLDTLRRDTFSPATALPGNYLITYTYSDSGCVFTTSDVLPVQNAATVEIVNTNPSHVSYEACVTDVIRIETNNFPFAVNSILLFNQQDAYTTVAIASVVTNTDTLAADVIYHQQLTFVVPDWAKGCFVRLVGTRHGGAADSTTTQFLLIHNEPLALSGLPNTICSNGTPIVLTGTPAGGSFILQNYSSAAPNTAADTTAIAGAFAGTLLSPANIPSAQYDVDGIDTLRVVYRFYSTFSNGNFCPQPDTAMQLVEARAVSLSQVRFNPISVSQTRERLDNLVKRVTPHNASPSRWLVGAPGNQHQIVYGGSFTTPAGAPEEFLPANAGVGSHTLTYTIKNGICANTVSDVIQVLPAPSPIAISDTICRNIAPVIFGRDPAMAYQANSLQFIQTGITFADTFNTLVVSSVDTSNYITVINPNVGLEQFSYQPVAPDTVLIRDTFLVQYIYSRVEYNNGLPFDTVTYVMASFYQPLFIEDTTLVNILDTLLSPVICENNQDVLVAATPSGGVFTLQGGTGAYATNSVLTNNILNSFAVHQNETANTNYILTYTLSGVACQSRDTFNFLIPEPLDPAFTTAGNIRTFCNSALPIPIVANTVGNFTNVLLVNGVAQPTMHFTPTLAIPGPQIVINEVTDADFGCITSYRDSFHVFPLPLVRIDTFAVREFCTNDSVFQFTIHPAPTCIGATGGELLTQGFNGQVLPAGWNFSNLNPASSGWGQAIIGGLSVAFVDTTSVSQNTWLYSAQIPMVAGGTYQVEYLMRVGPRNCASCADATMAVTVGGAANPAAQTTVLATYPTLDDNYAGFYTLQSHSFIAPTTGNFRFAFNATSQGRTTRWIAIDTVVVRQITAGNCLTGIGSISGAGIVNTPGNDSLYTFVPSSVAPGVYTMRYSFSDTRGCIDSVVVPIEVKPHPTVTMASLDPTYCWNVLPVPMAGTPVGGVFNINRLSGAAGNNMTLGGLPINNVTYNTAVPLRFTPRHVGVERIEYRYRDPLTQCATSVFDTVQVLTIPDSARFLARVNAPTNPNALLGIYCQTNPAVTLNVEPVRGTPQAGFFYGAGVLNGAGGPGVAQIHFDSAVAAMGRVGNDTLTYVYLASNGCQDTTRFVTRIEPIPTLSFDLAPTNVRLPDSICLNDPARGIQVRHQQWTGALGNTFIDTMIIFGAGTMNASALQIGDTINPVNFGEGWHNVSYYFRNVYGCENTIQDSFRVDTVPVIFFTGLPASRSYCENEQGGLLLAYPAYYPGSGYLQLGTRIIDSNFIYIDPAQLADPTQTVVYDIYYTFTNLRGCTADGTDSIEIRPFPRITFSLDSIYCNQDDTLDLFTGVTPIGGVFTDNLPVTSILQNRYLNLNSDAGPRTLTYFYTDPTTLCSNTATQNVTLYHTPTVAFQAVGGCQGVDVIFEGTLSNLDASFDSLTQVIWTFGDGNSTALTPIDPILVPSTTHTYTTHGYMIPSLTVVNRGLCSTTVVNNLTVSPTIVLNRYLPPYVEDFETSAGFWYPEQEQVTLPTDTVWSHRLLSNGHIVDTTTKAWVTYGNQAPFVYGAGHRAHIYSPCFDFTNTWRPMLSMDVWRDMNPGVDGAVLEYYEPTTRSWNVVGEINQGIRWYQSNFLLSRPGGQRNGTLQPTGWTGFSEGWDNVRYRLDQFAGKSSVRFRVAFAASSNTVLIDQPQGFAFDSVWIGERGRNVLVEHFTNFMTPDVYFVEQGLYDKIFNNMYGRDVTMIQYHIEVPSLDDQYNQANFVDPAARALNPYGLDTCNRAVVDGQPRGDGTTLNLDVREFDLDMLQFPAFSIFIDPIVISGTSITVSSTILALQDMPLDNYAIMTAVLEDSLPNQIVNQNSFIYPLMGVMRKLLPNNAGRNYNGSWWQGQQMTTSESYNMTTPIPSNPALLHAAVFIQSRSTNEVYQVATTRDLTIYAFDSLTNVVPGQPNQVTDETSSLKLYPNPATNYFTVEFEQALQTEQTWQLVDVLGRVLQTGKAPIGTTNFQINTENLSAAPYFFTIRNASVYTQRQVIITKP